MKYKALKILKWTVISLLGLVTLISLLLFFNKDKICSAAIDKLNTHLKVPVQISEVDLTFWSTFPSVSIDFKNVFIRDPYPNSSNSDTLLSVEVLSCSFNPIDIWNKDYQVKSIKVSNGSMQLKVNENGVNNYDIYKSSTNSTNDQPLNLQLNSILFSKVRFSYKNSQNKQLYQTTLRTFELKGDFNQKNYKLGLEGELLLNNLKSGNVSLINNKEVSIDCFVNIDRAGDKISIPQSIVNISGMPFRISGDILKDNYQLSVKANNLKFKQLIESFNHQLINDASKLKANGDVFFDLLIKGDTVDTNAPEVACDFGIKNASLIDPLKKTNISNLNIIGNYSNSNKKREGLYIDKIKCNTQSGPFQASFSVTKFNSPHIVGRAKGKINLKSFSYIFPFDFIKNMSGELSAQSNFDFTINHNESDEQSISIKKMTGICELNNVSLQLKNDKRYYKNMNGLIYLNKNKLNFKKLKLKLGSSILQVTGEMNNLQKYLKNKNPLSIDLAVIGDINISDFLSASSEGDLNNLERSYVLSNKLNGNIVFEFSKIIYDKHKYIRPTGSLRIKGRSLNITNFSTINANSKIRGNVFIKERLPELFDITCNMAADNLNIKTALKEWNNFYQTTIFPKNIEGDLSGKIHMYIPYDLRKGVLMSGLDSKIDLTLERGRLLRVKSLNDLSKSFNTTAGKVLFGKKNISHIQSELNDLRFLKLSNTIHIKNSTVSIPPMKISSSFLDMTIGGVHDFDNNIDYRFSFKFKDLLKQKKQDEFGEIIDDQTGIVLFIRMKGTLDNPIIEWDKESKKKQRQKNIQKAKNDTKSILKSEFGLYKNDANVKVFVPEETPKENFEVDFSDEKVEKEQKKIKNEKISNLKNKLNKLKNKLKQSEEDDEEFDID